MKSKFVRVPVVIPSAAHDKAVALAREAGWKRDRVIWLTVRDYLNQNDPDSAPERTSATTIMNAMLERQLSGARVRRPRYLVSNLCDEGSTDAKHIWQALPADDAKLLRKLPIYYGVTLGDLAVAAILWATGADEPSAEGSNVFAPRAAAPVSEPQPDPLAFFRANAAKIAAESAEAAELHHASCNVVNCPHCVGVENPYIDPKYAAQLKNAGAAEPRHTNDSCNVMNCSQCEPNAATCYDRDCTEYNPCDRCKNAGAAEPPSKGHMVNCYVFVCSGSGCVLPAEHCDCGAAEPPSGSPDATASDHAEPCSHTDCKTREALTLLFPNGLPPVPANAESVRDCEGSETLINPPWPNEQTPRETCEGEIAGDNDGESE